jgi:hydroxymethylpyrimidine pyrophosphatase-like HAD family hydrolase
MKNNIIIVDLDRTLLHTDKSVSDYTIQTLKLRLIKKKFLLQDCSISHLI